MVKVEIFKQKNRVEMITISGHSNFADKGFDIVCSAISSITYACINSFNEINKNNIELKDGYVKIDVSQKNISNHDEVVLEVLVNGLKMIASSYKKNVKILEKEIWRCLY